MKMNSHAPVVPAQCIELNGLIYVPHYTRKGMMAGPGGTVHLPRHLMILGGEMKTLLLWPRDYCQQEK